MVILMASTEHTNLWNTEVKIAAKGSFKSSIKRDIRASYAILLRPRPEYSLSVNLPGKHSRRILMRNSWVRLHTRLPSAHLLGSWMAETWLPLRPIISAGARDEDKIVECVANDSLFQKQFSDEQPGTDKKNSKHVTPAIRKSSSSSGILTKTDEPLEEPWLLQSSVLSYYVTESDDSDGLIDDDKIEKVLRSDLLELKSLKQSTFQAECYSNCDNVSGAQSETFDPYSTSSERDYPVEEPWLFQPSIVYPGSRALVVCDAYKNIESVKAIAEDEEIHDPHQEVQTELFPEKGSIINKVSSASVDTAMWSTEHYESSNYGSTISQTNDESSVAPKESVSTVILINSSLCTMQRIAVLEDGNLVELLLEPVKDNVQCDSVYLGVITKLVPHMGGAFVNIGSPRPSLMDIRPNRKPFIFPPFRRDRKERELTSSVLGELEEAPGINENEQNLEDADDIDDPEELDIQDISVQYMHDDFEEHETEDDIDVMEEHKENVNGSVRSHGVEDESERSLDQLGGNGHRIESQTAGKFLSSDLGFSLNLQPSHLQDLKDSKDLRTDESKWALVRKGTKIIVQVVKEGLGSKGPTLTAYPKLRSRFWVLSTQSNSIGISKKISGMERTRLRVIAKTLQPEGYGLTVRTVAAGHSLEELQKDLEGLLSTWKGIMEHAKSAALAADEGVEGAIPVMLHRAMSQTLSVVQDYFNDKVKCMIVDSTRIYHEVNNYLQEIAPDLCDRVELYSKRIPLFDEYNIEEELNNILSKRVPLSNGGYLVIEQTEALVSVDVNGGHCMLGEGTSQEKAILEVNLAAAKQIARELRLRDIGGIIVVDFIDMVDDSNKRLVYEEVKKAVERDRSMVKVCELSRHGLMEITRKRVRPSVTFMVSEPCSCCHATGRVEALETSFSKIEHEICRLLAMMDKKPDPGNPKSWPKFVLRVDRYMCNYLTSGKRTRLAVISSSLKVWILLKVARGFTRGAFELKPLNGDKDYKNHQSAISMLRPTKVGNFTNKGEVTIFPIKKWKTRPK